MLSKTGHPKSQVIWDNPFIGPPTAEADPSDSWLDYQNPLLTAFVPVEQKIKRFKTKARAYYFQVMLSAHTCEHCGGKLRMTGRSICTCENCHKEVDPTIAFQRSLCCGAKLIRRPAHYVCSQCKKIVRSRFLFDERVFDSSYFCEMMRASRERARRKKEAAQRLLAHSRSEDLTLAEEPSLEAVSGLLEALNAFIGSGEIDLSSFHDFHYSFDIDSYRKHILGRLGWDEVPFSEIPSLQPNPRRDRIYRFVTLVFMDHAGDVRLYQEKGEAFVQRVHYEADD